MAFAEEKKFLGPDGMNEFSEGDIILYKPGNYISYENIGSENTYESLMIFFNEKMVSDILKHLVNPIHQARKHPPIQPYYPFRSDAYLCVYLKSIIEHLKNNRAFNSTVQKIKLIELFVYLQAINTVDIAHLLISNKQQDKHAQLDKIGELQNIEQLSLDELAFMCNMSRSTFKRAFLKKYGVTRVNG